jgi:predicted nucleotidyltransferase component of viral defense system
MHVRQGRESMIELIKQQLAKSMSDEEKLNRCHERVQILFLKILDEQKLFDKLVFTDGTALRVVYGMKRFSEYLDFSLARKKGVYIFPDE